MEEILEVFNKVINKSGSTITLTYCHHNFSGTCVYEQVTTKGLKKPIVQNFFWMICNILQVLGYFTQEYCYHKDLRDKPIYNTVMYILNDDKQNYSFFR